MLAKTEFTDQKTGLTVQVLGKPGVDTSHQYFTAMSWMSDSRHMLLCTQIDEEKKGKYIKTDIMDGRTEVIAERLDWGRGLVSQQDVFYYYDGPLIYEFNLITCQTRTVCTLNPDETVYGPLSITNDGKKMGIYWRKGNDWTIGTLDITNGLVEKAASPGFAEPYPIANHAMINPAYPHLIFFSHEGQTEYIADRIYIIDTDSGIIKNAYPQKKLEGGELVEFVGHEMWSADGDYLYFVKYPQSPLKPTGVHRIDKQSSEASLINGDYNYWHVSLSPDGKWAVADTIEQEAISKIVLIHLENRTSRMLCELPIWYQHPGHPHPSFSPDSRKISFTFADEQANLQVGIIDLDECAL